MESHKQPFQDNVILLILPFQFHVQQCYGIAQPRGTNISDFPHISQLTLCEKTLSTIILIRFQNVSGGFDKEAKNPNKSCLIEFVKYQIDYNTERLFQKNGAKVEKQHESLFQKGRALGCLVSPFWNLPQPI